MASTVSSTPTKSRGQCGSLGLLTHVMGGVRAVRSMHVSSSVCHQVPIPIQMLQSVLGLHVRFTGGSRTSKCTRYKQTRSRQKLPCKVAGLSAGSPHNTQEAHHSSVCCLARYSPLVVYLPYLPRYWRGHSHQICERAWTTEVLILRSRQILRWYFYSKYRDIESER